MNTKIVLSELCTPGVIKANTGRNTMLLMNCKKGFLFPETWTFHNKINWKTLAANPACLYNEYIYYTNRFNTKIAKQNARMPEAIRNVLN